MSRRMSAADLKAKGYSVPERGELTEAQKELTRINREKLELQFAAELDKRRIKYTRQFMIEDSGRQYRWDFKIDEPMPCGKILLVECHGLVPDANTGGHQTLVGRNRDIEKNLERFKHDYDIVECSNIIGDATVSAVADAIWQKLQKKGD